MSQTTYLSDKIGIMPRHANQTSFKKGYVRDPASIERQKAAIARLVAEGRWISQLPEVRARMAGPNPAKAAKKNRTWKPVGTKAFGAGGHYIKVKIAEPNVWEYEHRIVAEAKIGRPLRKGEHAHHINGDKLDNRIENIVVTTHAEHSALPKNQNGHPRCPVCGYRHPPH